jgi:DNA-binding CsgD family transcriptional regulator
MSQQQEIQELKLLLSQLQERITALDVSSDTQYVIPAESFATTLTPYETLVIELQNRYRLTNAQISRALNRSPSSVRNAQRNANAKEQSRPIVQRPEVFVNISKLDLSLPPAQATILYLHEQSISNKKIAKLLARDARNISSMLLAAKKKRGELQ